MTRYVVIGAGAVGTALAAEFTLAKIDSVLVARGAQLRALTTRPLRYLRPGDARDVRVAVASGPEDIELHADDVLVLTVKAHQAEATLADWSRIVVDSGESVTTALPLVTLQNGLDTERGASRYFTQLVGASIWTPARYQDPGVTTVHGVDQAGLVWIGRYPGGSDDTVRAIAKDLTSARFPSQVVDDIGRWKRSKLLSNLGNAVDVFAADAATRQLVEEALRREARQVFAAAGLSVADNAAESQLDTTRFAVGDIPGHARARSTWQSLQRGAGSVETDYLNGEIVLLGKQVGVDTPVNRTIQNAVRRLVVDGSAPGEVQLSSVVDLSTLDAAAIDARTDDPDAPVLSSSSVASRS